MTPLKMEVDLTKVKSGLSDIDFDHDSTNQMRVESNSPHPFETRNEYADSGDPDMTEHSQVRTFDLSDKSSIYQSSSERHLTSTHEEHKPADEDEAGTPADEEIMPREQSDEVNGNNRDDKCLEDQVDKVVNEEDILGLDEEEKVILDEGNGILSEDREGLKDENYGSSNDEEDEVATGDGDSFQNSKDVSLACKEPGTSLSRHSSYQPDVFEQLSKKGSLIKEKVLRNNMKFPGKPNETFSKPVSRTGKLFLSPVSNCTDSDSESEAEKENRLRVALEFLLFPGDDLDADDARLALNEVRCSLRTGTEFYAKRLDRFLKEVYRAMKDFEENKLVQERACIVLGKIACEMPSIQKTIAETGGVKHIMGAIKRHTECDSVQDRGIFALLCITGDSVARAHIVEQRGAECVSWAMKEFQDIRTILINGSTTLCNIAFGCEESKKRIGKVGGIDAVINAMYRHQGDADLQARCCLALRTLTCGLRANQWIAGRACAMESIVRCMKNFPSDVNVQYQGCATLANICSTESENRDRATGIGVIETCVTAMNRKMDHIPLMEHGLAVLRNLCVGNEENQLRIGAAGGLQLILHAMKEHGSNGKILVRGCSALRFMFFSRPNRNTMFECQGLERLIRVLRDGENIPAVAESAILAMGNAIFDHKEAKRYVGRYGGIAAVADVMSKHLDTEAIQEYGCRALRNLADSDELNTRLLGDSGAVDTAIFAMMGYPNNAEIQEHSCAMLFNMAFSEHNMRIMKDLEVARVVEHATQFHLQNTAIQCQAMALLQRLRPLTESSSSTDKLRTRASATVMATKKSSADSRRNGSAGNLNRARIHRNQLKKKNTPRVGQKK